MKELMKKLRDFEEERNWDQFHSPKNLAIGISVEANELLEHFMWLTEQESAKLTDSQKKEVQNEVGDIMINLLNFCNRLDIDPIRCTLSKLEINRTKYPIDKSFGSAIKYNKL